MKDNVKNAYNLVYSREDPAVSEIKDKGFPRERNGALVYLASNIKGRRLLEIGCGNGSVLYTLRHNFEELHGMEVSAVRVKTATSTLSGSGAKIIEASIEEHLNYEDGFFDLVLWSDVIEHVMDLWRAMENIRRVTAKGGFLITTTPNIAKIKARISLMLGRFPATSGKEEGFAVRE
ncbi:MAG: class I SAM-dependent methyltransferase, partial [Candidatus Omnitrophica bacterium]|nr:class I SAM-dependent methyltransferase [Candidatus Omnitrophota bacterium]